MKTTSAKEALEAIKANKNTNAYRAAAALLQYPFSPVVTGKYYGSGRYISAARWTHETLQLLRSVGVEAETFNVAPQFGAWGDRVRLTPRQKHMFEVVGCLEDMYQGRRNEWRLRAELEAAIPVIEQGLPYELKRAQWGGKWGNWYRLIALSPRTGKYTYATGFNPFKNL